MYTLSSLSGDTAHSSPREEELPAVDLPFPKSEYQRRLTKVRAAMAKAEIDVLFVEDPSNMAWLTGYEGWSFYVHQGVIVFHDADPLWWGRVQDANGALRTVWMRDSDVAGYADRYIQSTRYHPMEDLAERLRARGYAGKRIGVEMENYYYSAKAHLVLTEALPEATFVDATALVNWQRAVKSPEEIVFMRRAAAISEKIVDGILARVEPGLPKNELVAEIYADEFSIGFLPLAEHETMEFLYDYGENWRLAVKLEKVDQPSDAINEPTIVESHGTPPPEYDFER